jgi:hypothetical protein
VTACLATGCSSIAIGVLAAAVVLARSDHPVATLATMLAVAAFFFAWMWVLLTRRKLPGAPVSPPADWAVEPGGATVRRVLLKQIVFAGVFAILVVIAPDAIGIGIGGGVWQLATAAHLRRWERRTGQRLYAESGGWPEFRAGAIFAV